MNKDIHLSAALNMNSLPVNNAAKSLGTSDYTPMLIGVNLNTDISVLDISFGSGLSMASGQVNDNDEYSMTTLYLAVGIKYMYDFENLSFMPDQFKSMSMSLGSNLLMIMGAPDDSGDTSNMVNLSMGLTYPFFF